MLLDAHMLVSMWYTVLDFKMAACMHQHILCKHS